MVKITDKEFEYLTGYLKKNYGINLTQKRILLEGRLGGYLAENGLSSYSEYIKMLEADKTGREITNLLNKVTTNHTYFMREADHFDFFRDDVLPQMEKTVPGRDLRVWCAAASTGEEPYTLAMILQDYFGSKVPAWDKTMLATDLSQKVLDIATDGYYLEEAIEKIPEAWKRKYFERHPATGRVRVVEAIRREVVYRKFNLMDKIVAKKPYHVVFCRNVMIYFDLDTKTDLIDRIYDVTAPGGFLFLGHTESISKASRFKYVRPSVYRRPL